MSLQHRLVPCASAVKFSWIWTMVPSYTKHLQSHIWVAKASTDTYFSWKCHHFKLWTFYFSLVISSLHIFLESLTLILDSCSSNFLQNLFLFSFSRSPLRRGAFTSSRIPVMSSKPIVIAPLQVYNMESLIGNQFINICIQYPTFLPFLELISHFLSVILAITSSSFPLVFEHDQVFPCP